MKVTEKNTKNQTPIKLLLKKRVQIFYTFNSRWKKIIKKEYSPSYYSGRQMISNILNIDMVFHRWNNIQKTIIFSALNSHKMTKLTTQWKKNRKIKYIENREFNTYESLNVAWVTFFAKSICHIRYIDEVLHHYVCTEKNRFFFGELNLFSCLNHERF